MFFKTKGKHGYEDYIKHNNHLQHQIVPVQRQLGGSLVQHPTLGFDSGHDLVVCDIKPHVGSALTAWSLLGILSSSLSAPPLFSLSKINKLKKKYRASSVSLAAN